MPIHARLCVTIFLVCQCGQALSAERKVAIERDVVYGHKVGMALTYDVVRPEENANGKGVLFMVSGGWFSVWFPPENMIRSESEVANPLETLVDHGFTVFLVRHGSGHKFTVPEAVDDVRRAALHIRENAARFGVDPEKLGVLGGSAGGHLSLMLGTTPPAVETRPNEKTPPPPAEPIVAAVVALFPPTDLADYVTDEKFRKDFPALQFEADLSESVSPLAHVSADDAPALLIHGTEDDLGPIKHSQQIQKALDESQVPNKLLVIEGAGHSFQGEDERRAIAAMVAWFEEHLLQQGDKGASLRASE
jgi:acetyl esterase/lipase